MFQSLSATRTGAGEACSKTCQGPRPHRDFIPTQWILVAGVPWANAKAANYLQPWLSLFSICHFSLWALDLHLGHQRLLAMAAESVWSWARAFPARKLWKGDIHLLKQFLHFLPWTWKQLTLSEHPSPCKRQSLRVYLEPICNRTPPSPVSVPLQPNILCTRCSERHRHQPQEHPVLSVHCSLLCSSG